MAAPVITPGGGAVLRGKQTQQFTADQAVTWKVDGVAGGNSAVGTISAGGLYTAPNITGVYIVQATNGASESSIVAATVFAVYPTSPDFNVEGEVDKRVLVSVAEDGTRQTRTKRAKKRQYDLVHSRRTKLEYVEVEQFWDDHYPGKFFYYADPVRGDELFYYFVSKLRHRPGSFDSYDFEVTVLQT